MLQPVPARPWHRPCQPPRCTEEKQEKAIFVFLTCDVALKTFFVSFLRSLFSIPYLFRDFQSWFLIGRVVFWANVLPLVCSSSPGVLALIYNFFWMFAMLCWLANQRTSPQFVLENLSSQKNQILKTNKLLTEFFVFTDCSWPTTLPSNICFFSLPFHHSIYCSRKSPPS